MFKTSVFIKYFIFTFIAFLGFVTTSFAGNDKKPQPEKTYFRASPPTRFQGGIYGYAGRIQQRKISEALMYLPDSRTLSSDPDPWMTPLKVKSKITRKMTMSDYGVTAGVHTITLGTVAISTNVSGGMVHLEKEEACTLDVKPDGAPVRFSKVFPNMSIDGLGMPVLGNYSTKWNYRGYSLGTNLEAKGLIGEFAKGLQLHLVFAGGYRMYFLKQEGTPIFIFQQLGMYGGLGFNSAFGYGSLYTPSSYRTFFSQAGTIKLGLELCKNKSLVFKNARTPFFLQIFAETQPGKNPDVFAGASLKVGFGKLLANPPKADIPDYVSPNSQPFGN